MYVYESATSVQLLNSNSSASPIESTYRACSITALCVCVSDVVQFPGTMSLYVVRSHTGRVHSYYVYLLNSEDLMQSYSSTICSICTPSQPCVHTPRIVHTCIKCQLHVRMNSPSSRAAVYSLLSVDIPWVWDMAVISLIEPAQLLCVYSECSVCCDKALFPSRVDC